MLKRLAEAQPNAVVQLKLQYRMHKEICALASKAIYDGKLGLYFLHLPTVPLFADLSLFSHFCQATSSMLLMFLGLSSRIFLGLSPPKHLVHLVVGSKMLSTHFDLVYLSTQMV